MHSSDTALLLTDSNLLFASEKQRESSSAGLEVREPLILFNPSRDARSTHTKWILNQVAISEVARAIRMTQIDVTDEHWAIIAGFLPFEDRRRLFVLCRSSVESPARKAFFEQCAWRVPTIEWLAAQVLSTLTMKHVIKRAVIEISWQQAYLAELTTLESVYVGYNASEDTFDISRLLPVGLKKLTLDSYYNFVSVSALARLVDLEELSIDAKRIDTVEVVGTLPHLQKLTLSIEDDTGADLEWIGDSACLRELHLTNINFNQGTRLPVGKLETLELDDCNLPSLDFLMEAAPQLTTFMWIGSHLPYTISEYEKRHFLRSLTKIETLRVSKGSLVNSLAAIADLTTMKVLDLFGMDFDDLSPLANLVDLEELTVHAPNADWSPIIQCNKLRMIDQSTTFDKQNDSSARALQQLPLLRSLKSPFCMREDYPLLQVTSLEAYGPDGEAYAFEPGCCPNIEKLTAGGGTVDIQSIADNFPLLKELSCYTEVVGSGFGPLSQLTKLERLDLSSDEPISKDMSFLLGMVHLKDIFMHGAMASELSALRNLKQLRYLAIEGDYIEDISVVTELKQLQTLSLCGSPVRDLTCLYGHPELRDVRLSKCAVCSPLIRGYGEALPNIALFWHSNCAECLQAFGLGFVDP